MQGISPGITTKDAKIKMFDLNLVELPKLKRIDGATRLYETPTGEKYPSVTTVLGATEDKSGLFEWKKRVGEEEAARVSRRATTRGTALHSLWEKLVLNEEFDREEARQKHLMNFHMYEQIEQVLKDDVNNIKCSEGSLFSHKLKIAGSVDLIADYKGKPSIIDFKTSGKPKRKEWISGYFKQTCLYSLMLFELTGIKCKDLVVMIAIEDNNEAQVFTDKVENWIESSIKTVRYYHSNF